MTPIEIVIGRYGYKVHTGTAELNLTTLDNPVVAIVVRSPGATFAKLEVNDVDIVTARGLALLAMDSQDSPICAGYDVGNRDTEKFNLVQLTTATDSIALIYGAADS